MGRTFSWVEIARELNSFKTKKPQFPVSVECCPSITILKSDIQLIPGGRRLLVWLKKYHKVGIYDSTTLSSVWGQFLSSTVTPGCGPCSGTSISFNDAGNPDCFVVDIPVFSYWCLTTCLDICVLNSLCAVYNLYDMQTI